MTERSNLLDLNAGVESFCTELALVERLGPCTRLVFAVPEPRTYHTEIGATDRQVVAKLIIPTEALPAMLAKIAAGTSDDASTFRLADFERPGRAN